MINIDIHEEVVSGEPTPLGNKLLILSEMIDDTRFAEFVDDTNTLARQVLNGELPITEELEDKFDVDFWSICERHNTNDLGFYDLEDFYLSTHYEVEED